MAEFREILEGYVVDVTCLRKYPREELLERARDHTQKCALMGHCLESGFALVDEAGQLSLLDSEATLPVADAIRNCGVEKGIRLRVVRKRKDGEMRAVEVQVVPVEEQQAASHAAVERAKRTDQWRRWREELISRLSDLQQSPDWNWPTDLAAVVEETFGDRSLSEEERQERGVMQVLAFYEREIREEILPGLEQHLEKAARLEVQDAFERWKTEASVA